MQETLSSLKGTFNQELAEVENQANEKLVESLRLKWLGRKGKITELYQQLKSLDKQDRPEAGKLLNEFKVAIESGVLNLQETVKRAYIAKELEKPALDVGLPTQSFYQKGALHPVTLTARRIVDVLVRYGFSVFSGPEIETDYYNFSALNIAEDHPARDMQDTFFVDNQSLKGSAKYVLRTHTSNIQIHSMLKEAPPLRLISPGRVYRVDNDATHSPMFHQMECVVVDKGISFAHLKGIIDAFIKELFGDKIATRLRPSYFPFVEPGAEVDMQCTMCEGKGCRVCSQTGWLEIGGCGMIHPNVFESVNYNSEVYTGFAFGFGIDRMAMLMYGLDDLRLMFEGDQQFLNQFSIL